MLLNHLLFILLDIVPLNHFLRSSLCYVEFSNSDLTTLSCVHLRFALYFIMHIFLLGLLHLELATLCLLLGLGFFVLSHRLTEGAVDDGKSQIEEKEGSYEDHWDEEEESVISVCHLVHLLNITPSFERDALEDDQQCPKDIVEVGHLIVGIDVLFSAEVSIRTHHFTTADVILVV